MFTRWRPIPLSLGAPQTGPEREDVSGARNARIGALFFAAAASIATAQAPLVASGEPQRVADGFAAPQLKGPQMPPRDPVPGRTKEGLTDEALVKALDNWGDPSLADTLRAQVKNRLAALVGLAPGSWSDIEIEPLLREGRAPRFRVGKLVVLRVHSNTNDPNGESVDVAPDKPPTALAITVPAPAERRLSDGALRNALRNYPANIAATPAVRDALLARLGLSRNGSVALLKWQPTSVFNDGVLFGFYQERGSPDSGTFRLDAQGGRVTVTHGAQVPWPPDMKDKEPRDLFLMLPEPLSDQELARHLSLDPSVATSSPQVRETLLTKLGASQGAELQLVRFGHGRFIQEGKGYGIVREPGALQPVTFSIDITASPMVQPGPLPRDIAAQLGSRTSKTTLTLPGVAPDPLDDRELLHFLKAPDVDDTAMDRRIRDTIVTHLGLSGDFEAGFVKRDDGKFLRGASAYGYVRYQGTDSPEFDVRPFRVDVVVDAANGETWLDWTPNVSPPEGRSEYVRDRVQRLLDENGLDASAIKAIYVNPDDIGVSWTDAHKDNENLGSPPKTLQGHRPVWEALWKISDPASFLAKKD